MADIVFPGKAAGGPLGLEFLPANYDLVLYKGDFCRLAVTLKDSSGNPIDLTGSTAQCSIKANLTATDSFNAMLTVTPLLGKVDILFPSSVTSLLNAGDYVWDMQITDVDGNVRTYFAGDVKVYGEVTT